MKISRTNKLLFKKLFTTPGNEYILLGFINDMLGMNFKSVKICKPYDLKEIDPRKSKAEGITVEATT